MERLGARTRLEAAARDLPGAAAGGGTHEQSSLSSPRSPLNEEIKQRIARGCRHRLPLRRAGVTCGRFEPCSCAESFHRRANVDVDRSGRKAERDGDLP